MTASPTLESQPRPSMALEGRSGPRRIQRRRIKGWRMPEGAVYVGRPTRWGNPWKVTDGLLPRDEAVRRFASFLRDRRSRARVDWYLVDYPSDEEIRAELAGRDLACWCPEDARCHADVLLEIANSEETDHA